MEISDEIKKLLKGNDEESLQNIRKNYEYVRNNKEKICEMKKEMDNKLQECKITEKENLVETEKFEEKNMNKSNFNWMMGLGAGITGLLGIGLTLFYIKKKF